MALDIVVLEPGSSLGCSGATLELRKDGEVRDRFPLHRLASVCVGPGTGLSSDLLAALADQGVPLLCMDRAERPAAILQSPHGWGGAPLRRSQALSLGNGRAWPAAQALVRAKIRHQGRLQRLWAGYLADGEPRDRLIGLAQSLDQLAGEVDRVAVGAHQGDGRDVERDAALRDRRLAGGQGRSGRGPDAMFQADREIFHSLLEDHKQIHRTVTKRPDGVETVTESDDPNVALAIQGHAAAMHDRVKKILPIHMRDALFAAVFAHATMIKMEITNTAKGVRVVETSADPYAVKLIQAHAAVVDLFVAHGFDEARKNHAVPKQSR